MDMHDISDMRYMHRVCAYVKYRQMFSICIYVVYADGEDMRMPHICRWQAYGYTKHRLSSFFSSEDPKKGRVGSAGIDPVLHTPSTQDVAALSSAVATRCCVMTLPCDPARRGRKDRFAYSLTVVHFRKVVNRQKIGSPENSCQVIRFRFYKPGCNCR